MVLSGEGSDLDQVVGEYSVAAPGSGAGDRGEFGAVPAVAAFDVVDPAFAAGALFDLLAERSAVFEFAAGGAGFALAGYRDLSDAELAKIVLDSCLAVAAVCGHRAGRRADTRFDAVDRWRQLGSVGRVPDLDVVIEDDTVLVVHDLGFVAELDRDAEAPLCGSGGRRDRAG